MKAFLPKIPLINFKKIQKNTFKNKFLLKNNSSNTLRLTRNKSIVNYKTPFKKRDILSILNNSLKLIKLKNLIVNKDNNESFIDSNKSLKEDYFSAFKNKQKSMQKISDINIEKENQIQKMPDNYKLFFRTFRKNYSKNNIKLNHKNIINNSTNYKTINKSKKNANFTTNMNRRKLKYFNSNISRISKMKSKEKSLLKKINFPYDNNQIFPKFKFVNKDIFSKYIIERFINNKNILSDKNHRAIYVILDGTIVLNNKVINGHFVNIPLKRELLKLSKEKREKLFENLLIKLKNLFGCKKPFLSIFSPDKEVILDLLEIKKEYKFVYLSQTIICSGISIIFTPNFVELYNTDFQDYLNQKNIEIKNKENIHKNNFKYNINKFKIKNINKGINAKKEKLKPHYSFCSGEDEIESNNYLYYSENEGRKNEIYEEIKDNCFYKNYFFIYTTEKKENEKIKNLKNKLNFKKFVDLKENYENYKVYFDKLINRYKKELSKKLGINPMNFSSEMDNDKNNYDFEDLDNQFDKLYLKRDKNENLNKKLNNKCFYNIDKNVNKYYAHLILYNIPKLLNEYKKYNRRKLFEIFTQYKDLMAMSFSLNKNQSVLKNGIDFQTFWKCIEELTDERENLAKKLFEQINRSNSPLLNIEDFIKGKYFLQNSELTEKLEIFLKSLDISGKGEITFKEAIEISKESILRYLSDQNEDKQTNLVLKELSNFFANFIFELVGIDKDKCLKISDLKNIISEGKNEDYMEYLEMFCGANKSK